MILALIPAETSLETLLDPIRPVIPLCSLRQLTEYSGRSGQLLTRKSSAFAVIHEPDRLVSNALVTGHSEPNRYELKLPAPTNSHVRPYAVIRLAE